MANTTKDKEADEVIADKETLREDLKVDEFVDNNIRAHFFRPAIICGVCESCGSSHYVGGDVSKVTNKNGEIEYRYTGGKWHDINATNCKHYKGLPIRCSYCKETFDGGKDNLNKFKDLLATRIVYVMSFEDDPKRLIMYCDSFECKEKHIKRIKNGI